MPSIVIEKKVKREIVIDDCPHCGNDDINVKTTCSERMVTVRVMCSKCGHMVELTCGGIDKNDLIEQAIGRWNGQAKSKDITIERLTQRVKCMEDELKKVNTVNNILKNVVYRTLGNPFKIGDLSDDEIIQRFGDTNLSRPLGIDN